MVSSSPLFCNLCGALNEAHADLCFACNQSLLSSRAADAAPLVPNDLFKDRYRVIGRIGKGGFGSVYKAIDTQNNDRLVAIKEVSLRELKPQAVIEATGAFHREVSLLSQLSHPCLPRLYEYFNKPEYWYLVMDFIEGETLEEYQQKAQDRRLLLSEVFNIGIQLCTVLEYLHSQQPPIVFRDLKPANIMRTPTGKLYLIDFGIARYFKPGQAKDTTALGSPGYAAPEQYGRAQTTPRADIYSLGALLHHLLTAKDPSEAPFCFMPLRVDSHLSLSDLEKLVASMVDMDMDKRPTCVAVVKQELQRIAKVWSAINLSFWHVGPQHTYLRAKTGSSLAANLPAGR